MTSPVAKSESLLREMLVNEQDLKTLERWYLPSVSRVLTISFKNVHLEEEPDGLAEDEDEDKCQENKAALGVRRGFSWTNIDINRYDNIKFRFMNFFVYMGMFWQLKFESMRG